MSARLFDGYLSALDPQHLHFLQSDLNEFSAYRTNLNRLTIRRTGVADTRPAYEIFYRYMDRLKEHVDYVDELLKTEKFDFTADDRAYAESPRIAVSQESRRSQRHLAPAVALRIFDGENQPRVEDECSADVPRSPILTD